MSETGIQTLKEYQLFCDGRLTDPYPFYHQLRNDDPVHWSDRLNSWVLTRYADVREASRDQRFSSSRSSVNMGALSESDRIRLRPLGDHVSNWLGFTDPPKHTRMRNMISKTFTPELAKNMRLRTQQIVDELIEEAKGHGRMDLVRDFAYPLPSRVICEILGVPEGNQAQFKTWADDIVAFIGGTGSSAARAADRAEAARKELTCFFRDLTLERRRVPRLDVLTALADMEGEEEGLTEQELLGLSVFLFVAGFETTLSLISNGILSLLQNRSELKRLKSGLSTLMGTAIEEFLRYESPISIDTRLVNEDLEFQGCRILEGQPVMLVRAAANRDPHQFRNPDLLDVGRQNNKHLAFGWGIHFCLGAPLARIEAEIAIRTLLERLPDIHLENDEVVWQENHSLRILDALPVTF